MGIFSRIINIAKSNSNSKNENYFVATEIENDDDELKKNIEDLNSFSDVAQNISGCNVASSLRAERSNPQYNTTDCHAEATRNDGKLEQTSKSNAFEILGINEFATETEINEAFKNKLKMFHPDKQPNSSKEEKEFFIKKTTEIIEAYNSIKNYL